jgi:hypothetical protein
VPHLHARHAEAREKVAGRAEPDGLRDGGGARFEPPRRRRKGRVRQKHLKKEARPRSHRAPQRHTKKEDILKETQGEENEEEMHRA